MRDATEVVVLLDRSGSMASVAKDMEGGFDTFLKRLREQPGECRVTLAQFDTEFNVVYEAVDLHSAPGLRLHPRGSTALLDSMDRLIDQTGARLAAMPEADRPAKVVFATITDGQENASRRVKRHELRSRIQHQTEKYGWSFIYLGANQDSFAEAGRMGYAASGTSNYEPTSGGIVRGMTAAALVSNSLRSGDMVSANFASAHATLDEEGVGDKLPDHLQPPPPAPPVAP